MGAPERAGTTWPASRPEARAWAWIVLVALLAAAAAFLYRQTRDTTLWFDEWAWVVDRRENGLGTFLDPYNGHISLVPITIYKGMFATAGLDDYQPYRAMVIAAHLLCTVLVFLYARRRVGGLLALLAAALILFLGPAWGNILWPFQTAWLISLAAGVGALLLLDRADRTGDVGACALTTLSLASSGVGVAVALGVVVDVASRRRWRDGWIVAAPLALYGVWWLTHQDSSFVRHDVVDVPSFTLSAAAAALSSLVGLSGQTVPSQEGTLLAWGAPLVIAAVAAFFWRVARLGRTPPRALALLTILVAFWTITALNRGYLGPAAPLASHYRYVGALFVVLLAVELARGISPSPQATLLLVAATAAVVVSNIGAFRDGARYLRGEALLTGTQLGALEIARPVLEPGYVVQRLPGFPFVQVTAGRYFEAADELGSPAPTPAQLAAKPDPLRELTDRELIGMHGVGLQPVAPGLSLGARPMVDEVTGGRLTGTGPCAAFAPATSAATGAPRAVELTLPPTGVLVTAEGGPAQIEVRRFSDRFQRLGTLSASNRATLRVAADLASEPWRLRVTPVERATVCGVSRLRPGRGA